MMMPGDELTPIPPQRDNLPAVNATGQGLVAAEMTRMLTKFRACREMGPRDEEAAYARAIRKFENVRNAEVAAYEYARGGTDISGLSIRAAEILANAYGKIGSGLEVVSTWRGADGIDVSEMRAYAVDYETGTDAEDRFQVRHERITRTRRYALTDDRDIDERRRSIGKRHLRGCILQLIPADLQDACMMQAEKTLLAAVDMSDENRAKLVGAFAEFGVSQAAIEKTMQRTLDRMSPRWMVKLRRIYHSLRDGVATPSQFFDVSPERQADATSSASRLRETMAARRKEAPQPVDPPEPENPATAGKDSATVLRRIRSANDFEALQAASEAVERFPEGPDRAMLTEALGHREHQLRTEFDSEVGEAGNDN